MKVMAIDDEPEVLKQIQKAISGAKGPDGQPYEVVAITDYKQALKLLESERFDVVITDMVMGSHSQETEGLSIVSLLTAKSPITIVLTAYPSIRNCVASMRAGAWDYLEKVPEDESDAYENLLNSLLEAYKTKLANPHTCQSRQDSMWVQAHLGDLTKRFAGEVVAVLDQMVVDHDKSYGKLLARIKGKYPIASPTIVSLPDTKLETV